MRTSKISFTGGLESLDYFFSYKADLNTFDVICVRLQQYLACNFKIRIILCIILIVEMALQIIFN